MALLLLLCGEVETNPVPPTTGSAASMNVETLPDEPSEQMNVIFLLLEDLKSRSVQSSECQAELIAYVKAAQAGIGPIENNIGCIHSGLDALEEKIKKCETIDEILTSMQDTIETMSTQHGALQCRVDELGSRSRRNKLLFHGISDSRETWQQSEHCIKEALTGVVDAECFENGVERAHRSGNYVPNKNRPIILRFSSHEMKDKVRSARPKLKEKVITVTGDFTATCHAREQLIDFAKIQHNAHQFIVQ